MSGVDPLSDVVVRAAGADDDLLMARIIAESWRAAYRELLPEEVVESRSIDQDREQIRMLLTAGPPGSGALVAELQSEPVAVSLFGPPMHEPDSDAASAAIEIELYMLYAVPGAWGTRAAFDLLQATKDAARSTGAGSMLAEVLAPNDRARRFFQRDGMDEFARATQTWFGHEVEVCRLRRTI